MPAGSASWIDVAGLFVPAMPQIYIYTGQASTLVHNLSEDVMEAYLREETAPDTIASYLKSKRKKSDEPLGYKMEINLIIQAIEDTPGKARNFLFRPMQSS